MLHEYDLNCFKRNIKQPSLPTHTSNLPSIDSLLSLCAENAEIAQPITQMEISIEFMSVGKLSRRVVKRSNFKSTYKVPSQKHSGSGMVQCESQIEVDAVLQLESNAHVASLQEQPAIINYFDAEGKKRIHYPDFLVKLINGNLLILEIKSNKESTDPQIIWRTEHIHRNLKLLGITYLLVSRSQILTTKARKLIQPKGVK